MTYIRVIPRDLFNEANLLKCLGQLYLLTERHKNVKLVHLPEGAPFHIEQSDADGSLQVTNIYLMIHKGGASWQYRLHRPLNSRDPWPLYATTPDDEEISVFHEDGTLSQEFKLELI